MQNPTFTESTVAQLVAERPSRAKVFERWHIDYCCGGNISLQEACSQRGLPVATLINELESIDNQSSGDTSWTAATPAQLCEHIVSTHHAYLREALPRLSVLTAKVAERHGDRDPRLLEVEKLFDTLRTEMEAHMEKEETLLFPLIRENGDKEAIVKLVTALESEHDETGSALERMRMLTDGFVPASNACNTHKAMLDGLHELELDMHQHVHKENAILFPSVIK